MKTMNEIVYEKCVDCGENLRSGSHDENGQPYPKEAPYVTEYTEAGPLCELCSIADDESSATIIVYGPEGRGQYRIGKFMADSITDDDVKPILMLFNRPKWIATDGWRGYFTIEPKVKTLRQVADGWVTGYPDETVAHKNLAIELKKTLEEFDRVPFTLFWVLAPTSNVFSQASTLYVPKKEYDQYKTWLRSVLNVSPDDVEGAFN